VALVWAKGERCVLPHQIPEGWGDHENTDLLWVAPPLFQDGSMTDGIIP
jgi:hypothetical protein